MELNPRAGHLPCAQPEIIVTPRHKLDFRNKKQLEQLVMFDQVIASGDALTAEQRQVIPALEPLRTQAAAAHTSHERIATLRAALKSELGNRRALFLAARQGASYTATGMALQVNFQPSAILGIGLALAASTARKVGPPGIAENFPGEPTASEGEARLRWRRPLRRCSFELAWDTRPLAAAELVLRASTGRQSRLVTGLESGGKYWLYLRAINAHGESAWSQPVIVRVK